MSLPRFFVDHALDAGATIELPERIVHHAARVLRLNDGAAVILFNGRGGEYRAHLRFGGRSGIATIDRFDAVEREAPLPVTLIQAFVAADKLDWIVEKSVELGVARVVLARCERDVVRLQGERLQRRLDHLRDVAIAACCQCGRNRVPAIEASAALQAALTAAPRPGFLLVPDASAAALDPGEANAVSIAVGPEGGFTEEEHRIAQALGFTPAQLGPRTLRTETAGLAALATLHARTRVLRTAAT